ESAHRNPTGAVFYDAAAGDLFHPNDNATRLVAAYAFVKAARLEAELPTATLPATMTDTLSIDVNLRPYIAVALNHGYLSLNGNAFDPSRPLTRLELAIAVSRLLNN